MQHSMNPKSFKAPEDWWFKGGGQLKPRFPLGGEGWRVGRAAKTWMDMNFPTSETKSFPGKSGGGIGADFLGFL